MAWRGNSGELDKDVKGQIMAEKEENNKGKRIKNKRIVRQRMKEQTKKKLNKKIEFGGATKF